MPLIQKTVYFREEDIEAWEKVPNKAEFLHNALAQKPFIDKVKVIKPAIIGSEWSGPIMRDKKKGKL